MRPATLARLGLGGACLLAPGRVLGLVGDCDQRAEVTSVITRALGGRMVAQGCADVALGRRTRVPGALVDLAHALSMLPAAARWPAHRRTALVSAAAATAIALLDLQG